MCLTLVQYLLKQSVPLDLYNNIYLAIYTLASSCSPQGGRRQGSYFWLAATIEIIWKLILLAYERKHVLLLDKLIVSIVIESVREMGMRCLSALQINGISFLINVGANALID